MKQITDIKEIQSIELGILEDIARFCDANGIRYTLSGGTASSKSTGHRAID